MQLLAIVDPTKLSYWLNWSVFLCALWVLTPVVVASYLIWKYEHSDNLDSGGTANYSISWKPCLKQIHPVFLMVFRVFAFCLLLTAVSFDIAIYGLELFYYYTHLGSLLSMYGCFYHLKSKCNSSEDMEQGLYVPLAHGENENGAKFLEKLDQTGKSHALLTFGFWNNLFHVLFQMTAGAVTITDFIYWSVIFPFIALRDYEMNFLTVVTHSINAVLLLGDTALNSLQFPWFRISYFIMFTGIYVIFQWVVHAAVHIWWPYPFLDLSAALAPVWPPSQGWIKINVDSTFKDGLAFTDLVIRDHNGSILLAATQKFSCLDPVTAEGLAILEACKLIDLLKSKSVIVESDCLNAITFITEDAFNCFWSVLPIIEKIKTFWKFWPNWIFKFAHRSCNSSAHYLAKWAENCNSVGILSVNSIPNTVFCDQGFPLVALLD
ncbi:hypothetical protein CASFOL_033078 [Castilleja foliolosa]|uniref:RNase H type-1 domain-containing protein n=1 Tax=Castilleja foliolosa TaxID=1961234 RepID=A0ABD3C3Y1_9LAMI